mgnify:CR=1 FL=1
MKSEFKNIEEQTKRMFSLFNDERLYGNLISEATDEDCIDQLEQNGYIITKKGSIGNKAIRQNIINCLERNGRKTPLGKVWDILNTQLTNGIVEIRETNNTCKLILQSTVKCGASQHSIFASVWPDKTGDNLNLQVLLSIAPSVGPKNTFKIGPLSITSPGKYIGLEGKINVNLGIIGYDPNDVANATVNYNGLEFSGLYFKTGNHISGSEALRNVTATKWEDKNDNTIHPEWEQLVRDLTNMSNSNGDLVTDLNNALRCLNAATQKWILP